MIIINYQGNAITYIKKNILPTTFLYKGNHNKKDKKRQV